MFKNPLNLAFEKLSSMQDEPKWLQQKRMDAMQKFQTIGLPTRKSELWKYTDVKRLESLEAVTDLAGSGSVLFFEKEPSDNECTQTKSMGSEYLISPNNTDNTNTGKEIKYSDPIDFKEQQFKFTIEGDLPENTKMQDILQVDESQWKNIKTDKERIFVDINTVFLNGGFELSIPANSQLKLHIQYQQVSQDWEHIRTIINVGENAELDLTESYDYDCRINHVAIINMSADSRLKRQSQKLLRKSAALIHYLQINCAQNVSIRQGSSNNNAALAHSIQDVNFNGQHSELQAASINVVHDSCHISENIQTNHFVQNCKSRVIKRSLATDKGLIALNAKAIVFKGADGSDISQSLKNILLSDDARINSRPELEINTDDVIAAHGSTTGQLDDLSMTYLRSRGILKAQAELMLIESFLQEANIFEQEDFLDRIEL